MAASFPNAKKTFSAVVNGVTKLVAALFNTPDDEIEAIETFIGPTGGGAQSYSDSVTNLLRNYREGCQVKYKSAADIYVTAGEIMITDASGNRRLRRNTSDLTVNWTNIDTGTEATSTTYYLYAIADAAATTFTVLISANATTPTGATFYKQIGAFYNNAAGDIINITDAFSNASVQVTGSNAQTSPGTYTTLDGMTMTFITYGTKMLVSFSMHPSDGAADMRIKIDGNVKQTGLVGANDTYGNSDFRSIFNWLETGLTPGSHTVLVEWQTNGGNALDISTNSNPNRILTCIDLH